MKNTHKKNVDNLLRLRCSRYRQTPIYPKRANAHAERREQSTSVLDRCFEIGDFEQQESKVDVLCLMSFYCFLSP